MSRGYVPLAAVATGTALLWWILGTQAALPPDHRGRAEWSGDFLSYYLPNAERAGRRLAEGALPLWNPHQAAGAPFLATLQPGVLYPPNWLHGVLPTQAAFVVLAFLHVAVAALASGALAGALGASPWGRALAGLLYATSLQVAGSVWSPPVLYTAAWAPALMLAVERCVARGSLRSGSTLALVLALALLAGWPYSVAIALVGSGVYALLRLVPPAWRERRLPLGPIAALAGGGLGGLLLAAPQLLPTWELLSRSCRALGSLIESQAVFVDAPHDPRVFLRSLLRSGTSDGVPGLAALGLAALALVFGPGRGRVAALLAAGLLGLLASFPQHVPVYGWLRFLPVLGDFRFPFRYRLLTALALAVAAGVGVSRLEGRLAARSPRGARLAVPVVFAVVLASAVVPGLRAGRPFARSAPAPISIAAELEAMVEGDEQPWAEGRVYWARRADKVRGSDPSQVVHDMEPLTLARTARLLTFFEVGRPLTLLTLDRGRRRRPPARADAVAAPFYGYTRLPEDGRRAVVLDLFSVGTLVTDEPPTWAYRRYRRISPSGAEPVVFANPWALPRAYRVPRAIPEPRDPRLALARLTSPGFDPRRVVMLDVPPPALTLRGTQLPPPPSGAVEIERYEPERVRLRTRGPTPALVVLTDAGFPGWEAHVDGAPAPLLRANFAFRAVAVPPGDHVVEMRYRPRSLGVGLLLAIAVAGVGGASLWRFRRPGGL